MVSDTGILMDEPPAKTHRDDQQFMKALVYGGPGTKSLELRPRPVIQAPGDAIVKMVKTTICGTDLHILKGDVPTCEPGRILGHEGMGIVEEVGAAIMNFKPGDRVLISCISADGTCEYCRKGMYSHCLNGGWILGNTIDGCQAECVRTPHADTSLYHIPESVDEDAIVMLSDILPTGFECGVLNGKVAPGSTVAIVGSGPIGLAALLTAQFYSPSRIVMIDLDDKRLATALQFGATDVINSGDEDAVARAREMARGRGFDTVIEAVGVPATFELCQELVAPGGNPRQYRGPRKEGRPPPRNALVGQYRNHHAPRGHGLDAHAAQDRGSQDDRPAAAGHAPLHA